MYQQARQTGGGNCSFCGAPDTNKTTCPLNPDAKNPNPLKHNVAAPAVPVQKPKPKPVLKAPAAPAVAPAVAPAPKPKPKPKPKPVLKAPDAPAAPVHARSNYVTGDKRVAMGAEPIPKTLPVINKYDLVIDLRDKPKRHPGLTADYQSFPIPSGGVPTKAQLSEILALITEYHRSGKSVYIHCKGGHGRSGTVAAVYIGQLYGLNGTEAIEHIGALHDARTDRGAKGAPAPENNRQVKFILDQLGVGDYVPDRSDTSWLRRK